MIAEKVDHIRALLPQGQQLVSPCLRQSLFGQYMADYGLDKMVDAHQCEHLAYRIRFQEYEIVEHRFVAANAVAQVVLVHGYTDHVGIYRRLIDYWLSKSISVTMYDAPGHGLSSGDRANIESFSTYVSLLEQRLDNVLNSQSLPVILHGQSMGGAVIHTLLLSGRYNQQLALVATNNPLVYPASYQSVVNKWRLGRWFVGSVRRTFTLSSHDQDYLRFVSTQDYLQPTRTPLKWVGAMVRWIQQFEQSQPISFTPHLVFQGTDDHTIDGPKGLALLRRVFVDANVIEIEGARHHLVNESEQYRQAAYQHIDKQLVCLGLAS